MIGTRYRRGAALGLGAAVIVAATALEYSRTGSAGEAVKALVASGIAVAVAALAAALPGVEVRGAALGGLVVAAGIFTWTFTTRPAVIWLVLGAEGVLFAVWAWPWRPRMRTLPRLGTAWMGLAYWVLGVAAAVLVGHLGVAAQRIGYAGVFTLAALAVLASTQPANSGGRGRPGRPDLSVGIAAAALVGIAALLLAGSGTVFDAVHSAPAGASAQAMRDRFWGGLGLFYHPNSMAGLAIVAAVRIGADRAYATWQRLGSTLLAGFVLFLSDSRIGLVFGAAAALVHACLVLRGGQGEPAPGCGRRPWLAALTPFAVLALVLVLSGTQGFFFHSRFAPPPGSAGDVTSGRIATWRQVAVDWEHSGWAEKVFGDARTARAVVVRADDGAPPGAPHAKLNTDNSAVGALRRGGVLGLAAFGFGVVLLLRRAWPLRRRGPVVPLWFAVAALSAVPTIATEDWMLGGTNGFLWTLLLVGEAATARPPGPTGPPVTAFPVAAGAAADVLAPVPRT